MSESPEPKRRCLSDSSCSLSILPYELVVSILSYLSPTEILVARGVHSSWNLIFESYAQQLGFHCARFRFIITTLRNMGELCDIRPGIGDGYARSSLRQVSALWNVRRDGIEPLLQEHFRRWGRTLAAKEEDPNQGQLLIDLGDRLASLVQVKRCRITNRYLHEETEIESGLLMETKSYQDDYGSYAKVDGSSILGIDWDFFCVFRKFDETPEGEKQPTVGLRRPFAQIYAKFRALVPYHWNEDHTSPEVFCDRLLNVRSYPERRGFSLEFRTGDSNRPAIEFYRVIFWRRKFAYPALWNGFGVSTEIGLKFSLKFCLVDFLLNTFPAEKKFCPNEELKDLFAATMF